MDRAEEIAHKIVADHYNDREALIAAIARALHKVLQRETLQWDDSEE